MQFKKYLEARCLKSISRALEFGQGMNWILNLLLGSLSHFGTYFLRLLWTHQGLLLRCLHLPHHNWWLQYFFCKENKQQKFKCKIFVNIHFTYYFDRICKKKTEEKSPQNIRFSFQGLYIWQLWKIRIYD